MQVERTELPKAQVKLTVELSAEEFAPYLHKGAAKLSEEVSIGGFRPGKAPLDVVKQKVGEMTVLEAAARLAIEKALPALAKEHAGGTPIGQPQIDITKLAPGNPLMFSVVFSLLPSVTLGAYRDLKVKERKTEVTEAEVEKVIADLRESRTAEAAVDRALMMNDKAIVDIRMFLDKVPLEGGQNDGVGVILGKEYVVPGFDKQLIGMNKGDVRDFVLPYPADFHMKNIAGKRVEFTVTLKDVFERTIPAADDALAAGFGLKHYNDLVANVKKSLQKEKDRETRQATERELMEEVLKGSRFGEMPEQLVDDEVHGMMHELEHEVEHRGGKFDDYLASLKKTRGQIMLDLAPDAMKRVKVSLMVRELAKAESIAPTPKQVDEQIEALIAEAKGEAERIERIKTPEYRRYVENVLQGRLVVEKLWEWNIKPQ